MFIDKFSLVLSHLWKHWNRWIPAIARSGQNFGNILFTFLSLELKVTKTQNLTGSNMTGNYQTSIIHSIKFENCFPSS